MRNEAPLLVVFDIDGTLTASVNVHQIAILRALERFGLQEIDTDWGSYLHFTDSWIFQANVHRAKGRYANEEEFAAFEELFEQEYRAASGEAAVDPTGARHPVLLRHRLDALGSRAQTAEFPRHCVSPGSCNCQRRAHPRGDRHQRRAKSTASL
jgi:beta-phosphoglucomutase-like phosphatase (HAD superfamily)